MRSLRREDIPSEISEVNIVPLADVSLVLLILLMVLSPMMTQDVLRVQSAAEAKIPPAAQASAPPPAAEEILVVAMHARELAVGENHFSSFGAFVQFMTSVLNGRADRKVFVSPDPDVAAGRVVNMIETLKSCGATTVALVQTI